MRFVKFRIKNFKSIVDSGNCYYSGSSNVLVLAGQNESGKSAVLEALSFFADGPSKDFERLQRRQSTHPEVSCTFSLLPEEIDGLNELTQNSKLTKYLEKNTSIEFVRGSIEEDLIESVRLSDLAKESLNQYFDGEESSDLIVKASKLVTTAVPETSEVEEDVEIEEPEISTVESLEDRLLLLMPNFLFYSNFNHELPGQVLVSEIPIHPAIADFEKVFNIKFSEVVKNDSRAILREEHRLNDSASDNLNNFWKQRLDEGSQYKFKVKITKKEPVETSVIEFTVDREDGDPLYMEQKSKGFRWFSAFNLKLRAHGVNKDTIKKTVMLIDEPGQGLHEKAQRDLKIVIEEIADKGAQIVYSTHHANLIGVEGGEFSRIRLISNARERGTSVETVSQFASRVDGGSKDALSPLITAMGIHSAQCLLDVNKFNVVVEGISDHYYLSAVKKIYNKDERLYFLPSSGANNVPHLVSILLGWGCNYRAILDDDSGAGRKAFKLLKKEFYENDDDLTKEYVFRLRNCNGIEDLFSKEDFFKYVLEGDLRKTRPSVNNSELVTNKKELSARIFLEKVERGEVELDDVTESNFQSVFDWLYEKYSINKNVDLPSPSQVVMPATPRFQTKNS